MALEQIGLAAILDDKNFQDGLRRYTQGTKQMESATDSAASVLTRLGSVASGALVVGIGAATAAFGVMAGAAQHGISELQQWGEGIDKLGDQFGLTGEKASGFAFLAAKVGAPVDELGFALNSLTNGLGGIEDRIKSGSKALSPFEKGLGKLGLSAFKANGKLKTFDELLPEMMDAFNKLPPGIKASSVAMDIFGTRGGGKMLDFLRQGSKGLKDATRQAKLLGLELSQEDSDQVEEFGFVMNELGLALKGAWIQIGKPVLPIIKNFVGLIVDNFPAITKMFKGFGEVIARVLEPATFILGDLFALFTGGDAGQFIADFSADFASLANVFGFDGVRIERVITDILTAIRGLVTAFQSKGLSGAIDEFGRLLGLAFKNFDLSKLLGDIGGKVVPAIQGAWTKISPELTKWGNQFWNWLTGKGGALEQAGTQLGKVVTAIKNWVTTNAPSWATTLESWKTGFWTWLTGKGGAIEQAASQLEKVVGAIMVWIKQNGPAVWGLIESWAGNFWNWITDSNSGLLVTVADNMGKLVTTIENWATDPATIVRFQGIGEDLARDVLDGIGNFFSNPTPSGENVLMRLWNTLNNARISLVNTFASIGGAIAGGIVGKIASYFVGDEAQQALVNAFTTLFTNLQKIMLAPGGPIAGFTFALVEGAFKEFKKAWEFLFGKIGVKLPTPKDTTGFGSDDTATSQSQPLFKVKSKSGVVEEGIAAKIRSSVSQPVINNTTSNARMINVTVPISGTFNGTSESGIEAIAQHVADRTVAAILNAV